MKSRKKLTKESQLYANLQQMIYSYDGDDELLDALLTMKDDKAKNGKCALLAWYMSQTRGDKPLASFYVEMSSLAGVEVLTPADARYLWFGVHYEPLVECQRHLTYANMRYALNRIDIKQSFWDSFIPYGYKVCWSLAAYVLRTLGFKYKEIMEMLHCSKAQISLAVKRYEKYNIELIVKRYDIQRNKKTVL